MKRPDPPLKVLTWALIAVVGVSVAKYAANVVGDDETLDRVGRILDVLNRSECQCE